MDNDKFWQIIDKSRKSSHGDLEAHVEALRRELTQLSTDEIVEFGAIFDQYWVRAYTWDLWGAAYIIGGGCSDDGFMDFRGWLISKGEQAYEDALKDAQSLVHVVSEADEDCQFEGFQYVSSEAWEAKTGRGMDDFPRADIPHSRKPIGDPWSEEEGDLETRFPMLCAKFG